MPKIIQERLVGYSIQIQRRSEQVVDNGQPVFNGKGDPKTQEVWDVVFFDPRSHHSISVGLDEQGRAALVAALTGGIVPAVELPAGVAALRKH